MALLLPPNTGEYLETQSHGSSHRCNSRYVSQKQTFPNDGHPGRDNQGRLGIMRSCKWCSPFKKRWREHAKHFRTAGTKDCTRQEIDNMEMVRGTVGGKKRKLRISGSLVVQSAKDRPCQDSPRLYSTHEKNENDNAHSSSQPSVHKGLTCPEDMGRGTFRVWRDTRLGVVPSTHGKNGRNNLVSRSIEKHGQQACGPGQMQRSLSQEK